MSQKMGCAKYIGTTHFVLERLFGSF